jgi:hypothetical protein
MHDDAVRRSREGNDQGAPEMVRRSTTVPAVRRRASPVGPEGGPLDDELGAQIRASRGAPLEPGVRGRMSDAFGVDLSAVRIHARSDVAPALSARAFTVGADVHFAPGNYAPTTATGQELLAHELSHVVQQSGGTSAGRIRRGLYVGTADDPAEQAADRLAGEALRRRPVGSGVDTTVRRRSIGRDRWVLRRRVDTTAMGKALGATTTDAQAYGVVADHLEAGRTDVFTHLDIADPRRTNFDNELDPLFNAVYDVIGRAPYTAANVVPPAKTAGARVNDVEARIKIVDAGAAPVVDAQTAQQARLTLAARYTKATELLAAVGTPSQRAALARAEREVQKQLRRRDFHATRTRAALGDLVTEMETAEAVTAPSPLMKIGTEFTFTNNQINRLDLKNNQGDHFKAAVRLITAWAAAVPGTRIMVDGNAIAAPARSELPLNWAAERQRPKDADDQRCIRFTYTLPSRKTWWWQLNVDYQCIETQTDPATRALMSAGDTPDGTAVASIITSHIFGIAASQPIGLAPHATIGGGHVTIDRATAFGDNARWLRNYLVLYSNDPVKWGAEDPDVFNAPMIQELKAPGPAKFKAVIARFDNGQLATADLLVKALRDEVFVTAHLPNPRTRDEEAANASRTAQPVHYQAVNLENWDDPEGGRLEMRRFDAQTNLNELLRNVDDIIALLLAARAPGTVAFTW